MDWESFFKNLPAIGWVCILLLVFFIGLFFLGLYLIVKNKDIKIKNVEIASKVQREFYQTEGKNVLDNQSSNAHNLLKKIWIDIYDTGKLIFKITDTTELFILEDIAHLIESKLNYEVKNDLTRNHIIEKTNSALEKYSEAKAIGYYRAVKAALYQYNAQLPKYDLPLILNTISVTDYKKIFLEIYSNAQKIAGGKPNE